MKALSKEERAAKFSTKENKIQPGLRSRGFRKLSIDEREQLYLALPDQRPSLRLDNLRILREAFQCSEYRSNKSKQLELDVWKQSIEESIRQNSLESVPHLLTHITTLTKDSHWRKLNVISLANTKKFHDAFLHCTSKWDREYVRSVATLDIPLHKVLMENEPQSIAQLLMKQVDAEFEKHRSALKKSLQHPGRPATKPDQPNN